MEMAEHESEWVFIIRGTIEDGGFLMMAFDICQKIKIFKKTPCNRGFFVVK